MRVHVSGRRFRGKAASIASSVFVLLLAVSSPGVAYPRSAEVARVDIPETGGKDQADGRDDAGAETSVSSDGRFVVFATNAPLVPADGNPIPDEDIYLRDMKRGTTKLISQSPEGLPSVGPPLWKARHPVISADGRYIAFASQAINLVPGDINGLEDIFLFDRKSGSMEMVSLNQQGEHTGPGSCGPRILGECSWGPSMSLNGRYISFTSWAPLVDDDTNGGPDIFVRDRKTAKTVRASVNSQGRESDTCTGRALPTDDILSLNFLLCEPNAGWFSSISADGRWVAFESNASDLVNDDRNGQWDVFVRDLRKSTTERVSVASNGTEARENRPIGNQMRGSSLSHNFAWSPGPSLSRDGRFVAFHSFTENLVPNDANWQVSYGSGQDAFIHDRKTGRTERASVTSKGEETIGGSRVMLSADGRFVAFACACDPEMTRGESDTSGHASPFLHDRTTGALHLVAGAGPPSYSGSANAMEFATSGRFITFSKVAGYDDYTRSYWRTDLGPILGIGGFGESPPTPENEDEPLICIEGSCIPPMAAVSLSGNAREINPALTESGANLIGGAIAYRPALGDLYVSLELESMPRTPALAAATAGIVYGMSFQADGRSYEIRAASTGLGSRGETTATFGLFSCKPGKPLCTKVTDIEGGFGTTGERITFSVPLSEIEVQAGSPLTDVKGFTALGSYVGKPKVIYDRVHLR